MVIDKLSGALQNKFEAIDTKNRISPNRIALSQAGDYVKAAVTETALATLLTAQAAGKLAIQFTVRPITLNLEWLIGDLAEEELPNFETTFATAALAAKHTLGVFVSLSGAFAALGGYSQLPLSAQNYLGNFNWTWMKREAQDAHGRAVANSTTLSTKYGEIRTQVTNASLSNDHVALQGIVGACERLLGELRGLHASLATDSERARKASSALWEKESPLPSVTNEITALEGQLERIRTKQRLQQTSHDTSERIRIAGEATLRAQGLANQTAQDINRAATELHRILTHALKIEERSDNAEPIIENYELVKQRLARIHNDINSYDQHCRDSLRAWIGATGSPRPDFTPIDRELISALGENWTQFEAKARDVIQLEVDEIEQSFSGVHRTVNDSITLSQNSRLAESDAIQAYLDQQRAAKDKLSPMLGELFRNFEACKRKLGAALHRANQLDTPAARLPGDFSARAAQAESLTEESLRQLEQENQAAVVYSDTLPRVMALLDLLKTTLTDFKDLTPDQLETAAERSADLFNEIKQFAAPLLQESAVDATVDVVARVADDAFLRMVYLQKLQSCSASLDILSQIKEIDSSDAIKRFVDALLNNVSTLREVSQAPFVTQPVAGSPISALFVDLEAKYVHQIGDHILRPLIEARREQFDRLPEILQNKVAGYLHAALGRVNRLLQWVNENKPFISTEQRENTVFNELRACALKAHEILPIAVNQNSSGYLEQEETARLDTTHQMAQMVTQLLEIANQIVQFRKVKYTTDALYGQVNSEDNGLTVSQNAERAMVIAIGINKGLSEINVQLHRLLEDEDIVLPESYSKKMNSRIDQALGTVVRIVANIKEYTQERMKNPQSDSDGSRPYSYSPAKPKPSVAKKSSQASLAPSQLGTALSDPDYAASSRFSSRNPSVENLAEMLSKPPSATPGDQTTSSQYVDWDEFAIRYSSTLRLPGAMAATSSSSAPAPAASLPVQQQRNLLSNLYSALLGNPTKH